MGNIKLCAALSSLLCPSFSPPGPSCLPLFPGKLLPCSANLTLRTGRHCLRLCLSLLFLSLSCVSVSNRIISMLIARHFVVPPLSLSISLSIYLLFFLLLIILSFMQSPWPLLIRLFAAWVTLLLLPLPLPLPPPLLRFVCILINVFLLVMLRSCLLKGYDCALPFCLLPGRIHEVIKNFFIALLNCALHILWPD